METEFPSPNQLRYKIVAIQILLDHILGEEGVVGVAGEGSLYEPAGPDGWRGEILLI